MRIKRLIFCFAVLILFLPQTVHVQTQTVADWSPKDRNFMIEMLFPNGKSKALILSYDDGSIEDRKLVSLLNKYGLKGTFHLNSGKFSAKGIIGQNEIKALYEGHEVSVHGYNHLGMKELSATDLFYEVGEDRRMLEKLSGKFVRGMAYPFGSYNEKSITTLRSLGIEYARTVDDSYSFGIPQNPLLWHPTAHKFAKMDYEGNSKEINRSEYEKFLKLTDDFLKSENPALFYVWGHSWEYTNKWDKVEDFFKSVSNREDISYLTHIELIDYLNAFRRLKISADKSSFLNLSAVDIFIKVTDYRDPENPKIATLQLKPGKHIKLKF
jgi:peptidoglycan/xylan/chitin deacetylase (PgdA/CDA1 family)